MSYMRKFVNRNRDVDTTLGINLMFCYWQMCLKTSETSALRIMN